MHVYSKTPLEQTLMQRNLRYCEVLWNPQKNSEHNRAKFYDYNQYGWITNLGIYGIDFGSCQSEK